MKKKIRVAFLWILAVLFSVVIGALPVSAHTLADGDSPGRERGWGSGKNLDDYSFVRGVISTRVTLDSLGDVNLVSFYYNDLHPTLQVVLADDEGNILYEFCSMNGLAIKVLDIFVEDMDGDGREDIKIILGMYEDGWSKYRFVHNYYQTEGGFDRTEKADIPKESVQILQHLSGCYRIAEACPVQSITAGGKGMMIEQETDMMLGRTVIFDNDFVLVFDCEKKQGIRKGGDVFSGNYMVQRFVLSGAEGWAKRYIIKPDCILNGTAPDKTMEQAIGKGRYTKINGRIKSNENELIQFYTMEGTDDIIMESYLSGQYFVLKKLSGKEEAKALEEIRNTEGGADEGKVEKKNAKTIMADTYGTYTIKEFLPTRYYEGKDDTFLPGGEPEWMIGKKVTIGESSFITYDNYRWSYAGKDKEPGKWFQKAEIQEPEYRLTRRKDWETFGLKDDGMLPEGMEQEEYMEVAVYPGLRLGDDRYLPQLFLLDDGRILMYSMGQYFLLEKDGA